MDPVSPSFNSKRDKIDIIAAIQLKSHSEVITFNLAQYSSVIVQRCSFSDQAPDSGECKCERQAGDGRGGASAGQNNKKILPTMMSIILRDTDHEFEVSHTP